MDEAKQQEQELEEIEDNKKGFIEWVKEHKNQLALIGVSGAALIAMVFGQMCIRDRAYTARIHKGDVLSWKN